MCGGGQQQRALSSSARGVVINGSNEKSPLLETYIYRERERKIYGSSEEMHYPRPQCYGRTVLYCSTKYR